MICKKCLQIQPSFYIFIEILCTVLIAVYSLAIVTSTSTPGSIEMLVICFTISDGEYKSITLLWIRIWKRSHVFEPSPQGVLRVVILKILVGMRTGPLTFNFCFLAPLINSAHTKMNHTQSFIALNLYLKLYTDVVSFGSKVLVSVYKIIVLIEIICLPFSRDRTLRDVSVILIRWMGVTSCPGFSGLSTLVVAWEIKKKYSTYYIQCLCQ